jgi:hypothetical protein
MEANLTFRYDREADILHIDQCPPYAKQESEELPDEVIARLNPERVCEKSGQPGFLVSGRRCRNVSLSRKEFFGKETRLWIVERDIRVI